MNKPRDESGNCACKLAAADLGVADLISGFEAIRTKCPALHLCLVPDRIWPAYREFCVAESDAAHHVAIALQAYRRGYLSRLTGPIHEFCLEGARTHPNLTNQYRQDLAETWLLRSNALERFKDARRLKGRLTELAFAATLKTRGWKVTGLEALGGLVDVQAENETSDYRFEVKHLGVDEVTFDRVKIWN